MANGEGWTMDASNKPVIRLTDCCAVVRSHLRTWLWLNRRRLVGRARSLLATFVPIP